MPSTVPIGSSVHIGERLVGAGRHIHRLLRQSEVEDLYSFVGQNEDVFWLEVTMHNTFLVSCRESLCNLQAIFIHPSLRKRTGLQPFAKSLAFEKF